MKFKKTTCLILSFIFIFSIFTFTTSADNGLNCSFTYNKGEWKPLPLLCILVSYDANGNGEDDYDEDNPYKLYSDSKQPYYGEQWIHSDDRVWNDLLFGKQDSVATFFKENTNGTFYITPAKESYYNRKKGGKVNDGIVHIVLNEKHNEVTGKYNIIEIIEAASEYVNYGYFDTNSDGIISDEELCIYIAYAGSEKSYNSSSSSTESHFKTHARYSHFSSFDDGYTFDKKGIIVSGESLAGEYFMTVGPIAHELCHYLGFPDLYDTSYHWEYNGYYSLMNSGSWNSANGIAGYNPSYLSAPTMVALGFVEPIEINEDGKYTSSSRSSENGYNVYKISTPNPHEYYLIENRSEQDKYYSAYPVGGIAIWHVDEEIFNKYCSSNEVNTYTPSDMHDPGIVLLPKNGFNKMIGTYYQVLNNDSSTLDRSIFTPKSMYYKFPVSKTSFTSLSEDEAKDFNFVINILSNIGPDMEFEVNFSPEKLEPIVEVEGTYLRNTVTINGFIPNYDERYVKNLKIEITKNNKEYTSTECEINEDGSFSYTFKNIKDYDPYDYTIKITLDGYESSIEQTVTPQKSKKLSLLKIIDTIENFIKKLIKIIHNIIKTFITAFELKRHI